MQKLIIQDITKINAYWYAVRFNGTESPLNAMYAFLAQQSKENAYWDGNALDGKGAWIIRLDFLRHLTNKFANLERGLVIAERMAAQKKISSLVRRR